ncbi:MAG TPA: GtrA family protein [Anaerolineales bacterium]|nr:GtrA family protein [Anaerolineales bacterium]
MSTRARREWMRFLKFSVVGTIGAVVDFGTFNVLHTLVGVASIPASVASFLAAVTSNFLWNRFWTYPDSRAKPTRVQASQFAIVSLIGLAIRTPLFAVLETPAIRAAGRYLTDFSPSISISPDTIGRNLALAVAVGVVLVWNFLANRYWTYSDAP